MHSWKLALPLLFSTLCAAPWNQHGGPDRNGISKETGLIKSFGSEGPKQVWRAEVGQGYAGVAISGAEVYMLDHQGNEDILRCWNAEGGSEVWRAAYETPGDKVSFPGSRGGPTLDDEQIYAMGVYGHLSAFSRQSKKLVWQKSLMDEFGMKLPTWGFSQCPIVYKDTVIAAIQDSRTGIGAYEKKTGKKVWETRGLDGEVGYVSPSLITVEGVDMIVAVSADGEIAGFEANDGTKLWSYKGWRCKIPITAPLHVGGGRVFVTGGYRTGSVLLQLKKSGSDFEAEELLRLAPETAGAQVHIPILFGEYLYLFSNSNEKKDGLICLSLLGERKWATGNSPNFNLGGALFAEGLIWAVNDDRGELVLIEPSPEGYRQKSAAKILNTKQAWCPPALADGKLYVRDQKTLLCLDVKAR